MANLPQRFGQAVRQLRTEAGYSQEGFAIAAKIDRRYYAKIERGDTNVSLEVIARIAKGLKIGLTELFGVVEGD